MLEAGEQVRHVIVHNGGHVSAEYLRRTRRTDLALGSVVPLDDETLERISIVAGGICGEVFIDIATSFFGASDAELSGVWRRMSDAELSEAWRSMDADPGGTS